MSDWPVRYRKNPIECSLCKTLTHEPRGVCSNCRNLYERGKSFQKAYPNEGERPVYWTRSGDKHFSGRDPFRDSFYLSTIIYIFKQQEIKEMHCSWEHYQKIVAEGNFIGNPPINSGQSVELRYAILEEAEIHLMDRILSAIPNELEKQENWGKIQGSGFLNKMASGELSIEQINNWHTKLDKK